jgi:hypothetical protein
LYIKSLWPDHLSHPGRWIPSGGKDFYDLFGWKGPGHLASSDHRGRQAVGSFYKEIKEMNLSIFLKNNSLRGLIFSAARRGPLGSSGPSSAWRKGLESK